MVLKLSGSEKVFKEEPWASIGKKKNNCYNYAVNNFNLRRTEKSVPGDRTRLRFPSVDCRQLSKRVLLDNPRKVYRVKPESPCKLGFYKIMMVTTGRSKFNMFSDFHFYKQHGVITYTIKKGDTYKSLAQTFGITPRTIGPLLPGRQFTFKKNLWSHKRGWATGPLLVDACGKTIKDPRKACRNYGQLDYSRVCGSFCVKDRGVKSGKTNT